MSYERTFVGLDVHARSVTGHALDATTGEVWQRKLTPEPADIVGWVSGLPGPVAVVYEAGPTGSGWPGTSATIRCGVWWRRRRSCSGPPGTE